jgi:DNA-binding CsgD family transcriptional regulator
MTGPMPEIAVQPESERQPPVAASRSQVARLLMRVCADVAACRYMVLEPISERGRHSVRIVASNWSFDAIEAVGLETIAKLIEDGRPASPGTPPRAMPANMPFLASDEAAALREYGHAELFCLRSQPAGRRFFLLFSSERPLAIDVAALARAHIKCCYVIGRLVAAPSANAVRDLLTERERECLLWVSEGKTTDEVALILGVSANTVNSYVGHAISKFGASNRAMAIATAIRNGII